MRNTLLSLLLLGNLSLAQDIEVKDLVPKGEDTHFPLVVSKKYPKIAEKMNIALQVDMLKHLPDKYKDPFKLIEYKSFEEFSSIFGKKYLNISVGIDGCGAYCEYYIRNFNFDLTTGDAILLRDILSDNGIKEKIFGTYKNLKSSKIMSFDVRRY